jgi:glutathione S-transferase
MVSAMVSLPLAFWLRNYGQESRRGTSPGGYSRLCIAAFHEHDDALQLRPTFQRYPQKENCIVITLYTFGPFFGLPDPSPFVMKAEVLLKMAKLPYRADTGGFSKAPKGKLPYIDDDGAIIADSTFIRWHLEKKYRIDFDQGLDRAQRATTWAFEKMIEDNLYWVIVHDRWADDANFRKGPVRFFDRVPAPIRPLVVMMIRRKVRGALHGQGIGRHSNDEIQVLGTRSIAAIADFLGDKPFFFGAEPTGIDATVFAFVAGALCPHFVSPTRTAAERHDNLRRYVGRMTARFYPELGELAGCKAAA